MVRIFFILLLFFTPSLLFAEAKASITVSPSEGAQDDEYTLTLDVWGIDNPSSVTPYLVGGDSFAVNLSGKQIGVVNENGKTSSSISFSYTLSPKEIGSLLTPGAEIEVDGHVIKVEAQRITVKKGAVEPIVEKGDVFIKQKVDIDNPYIGQQIVLTVDIYTAINLMQPRIDVTAPGFLQEELGKESNHERLINGVRYEVISLRKSLFPQKEGSIIIPSQTLTAMVRERQQRRFPFPGGIDPFDFMMGFDNITSKSFRSPTVAINVQPLPSSAGDVNIVGETSISVNTSTDTLKLGDSATLSVVVESAGDLSLLKSLPINFPEWIKIYSDTPEKSSRIKNGRILSSRTFKISIVPTKAGEIEIPSIVIPYFDPNSLERKEVKTEPLKINIEGTVAQNKEPLETNAISEKNTPTKSIEDSESTLSYLSKHVSTGLGLLSLSITLIFLTIVILWGRFSKKEVALNPMTPILEAKSPNVLYQEICKYLSPEGMPVREAVREKIPDKDRRYEVEVFLDDLERAIFSKGYNPTLSELRDKALKVIGNDR